MKNRKKYCNKTGKFSYPSESAASRAKNKYGDIRRTYFCSSCKGFHTTSQTIEETLEKGNLSKEETKDLEYKQLLENYKRLENSLRRTKGEVKMLKHNIELQKKSIEYWKIRNKVPRVKLFFKKYPIIKRIFSKFESKNFENKIEI